jgi:1-acyl-sn-glycerol-3-phosphate acyltransferase
MLYELARLLSKVFFSIFYRVTYEGLHNIPKIGALIVCANHISMLDMFLFGPVLKQQIHFMAKKELFRIPVLNLILKRLGAYPVNRGRADMQAAKTTLMLLKEGKTVGIFPEGHRRNKTRKKIRPKTGAVLFAIESGVPILPVGIFGSYKPFSKIRVVYGKPYYIKVGNEKRITKPDLQEMADDLMGKIYSLEGGQ